MPLFDGVVEVDLMVSLVMKAFLSIDLMMFKGQSIRGSNFFIATSPNPNPRISKDDLTFHYYEEEESCRWPA